ncbi:MAG: TRAP transporter small permease subunit [Synergistaceae bacterium]|jgi:TRAP-type C4-dicarboxylate transport system permease small subunit|nr:TRAP transporter small permease subunit [Synergistaceae bacterium]
MKTLRLYVERFNLATGYLCGLGILAMGLILAYEVVCRYFFEAPTIWAQETAGYLFMWTMLAGSAYTLMQGKHVRIDLIFEHLPRKVQCKVDVLTSLVGVAFCAMVSWQAWEMVSASLRFGKVSATLLRVPMWIPQCSLLLGFVLLTFQFAFIVADRLQALRSLKPGPQTGGDAR